MARTAEAVADTSYMAVAARRGHPQCKACALPVEIRAEIAKRRRRGDSLRAISAYAVNEGHALGKDGIALHLRQCVGIEDKGDGSDPETRSILMARIVGYELRGWPGKLNDVAQALGDAGLSVEADVIQADVPESMRRALALTGGTPAGELLAAGCLALAMSRVFSVSHEQAARAIGSALKEQGADELSGDLLWLADQASAHGAKATP